MSPRVFTFLVKGGSSLAFQVPGNAPIAHDGKVSLWALVLTPEGARQVEAVLTRVGARVAVTCAAETPEQGFLRDALRDLNSEALPTASCGACFWLDPSVEGFCGRLQWEPSLREAAVDASAKARTDAQTCPLLTAEWGGC
jgi:hypothetical protein